MLKQYISRRAHTVVEEVIDHAERICDHCKKPITDHYWHVETYHDDWGNDSIDSIEYFDCCSPDCLREALETYICDSNNGSNSRAFEVEHINAPLTPREQNDILENGEDPSFIIHEYLEDENA